MKRSYVCFLTILAASVFCLLLYQLMQYNLSLVSARFDSAQPVIIIDAGHGGEDGGAVSNLGVKESAVNLSVALRFEQILALCGFHTSMLRSNDIALYTSEAETISDKKIADLKQRVKLCNAIPTAILISIHQNHFDESQYSGAQVFYAKTAGSKEFADLAQNSLRDTLNPANHRASTQANSIYLMNHINCTGILVECGFLSNPAEASLLQDQSYQIKICCALTRALTQFLQKDVSPNEI